MESLFRREVWASLHSRKTLFCFRSEIIGSLQIQPQFMFKKIHCLPCHNEAITSEADWKRFSLRSAVGEQRETVGAQR